MPTLAQIREGLAANLEAGVADVQVSAYLLSRTTAPSLQVSGPQEVDFDEAFGRGLDRWTLTVWALAGAATDKGAQKRLDAMIDPSGAGSVKAAVEADTTLGGIVDDLRVETCSGYTMYALNDATQLYLGAQWRVAIYMKGA